jgi:hypothetical protein
MADSVETRFATVKATLHVLTHSDYDKGAWKS